MYGTFYPLLVSAKKQGMQEKFPTGWTLMAVGSRYHPLQGWKLKMLLVIFIGEV